MKMNVSALLSRLLMSVVLLLMLLLADRRTHLQHLRQVPVIPANDISTEAAATAGRQSRNIWRRCQRCLCSQLL